jgi:GcrA cell cycle regulator
MRSACSPWTDERCEMLRRLWADGLSASAIAKELGATRSGVLGKVMRLGLTHRKSSEFKPGPPRPKVIARRAVTQEEKPPPRPLPPPEPEPEPEPTPPKPRRLTLLQLGEHHCRWPVEDYPEFRFCGAKRQSGETYCAYHRDKAHVKPRGQR